MIYLTVVKFFQIPAPSPLPEYLNYFSQCQANHHRSTTSQYHSQNHVPTLPPSSSHTWQTFLSHRLFFHPNSNFFSELHWLLVCHRINLKIATVTFRFLQFQQPSYLAALIPRYVPTRSLRSSSSLSLCVPNQKTEMAKSKSFSYVASSVWNKLPGYFSSISTLPAFRKRLKHHLFRVPFPVIPHHPLASRFEMSAHPQMQLRSDTPHHLANTFQLSAYG